MIIGRIVNGRYVREVRPRPEDQEMLAEMLEARRPPTVETDNTFMAGKWDRNVPPVYREIAHEQGQNTSGKVYLHGLAEYPGDPRAWVDGRGDVKKLVEERGWSCEGSVNVKPTDARVEPTPGPDLAPDIVEAEVESIVADCDHVTPRERADLTEQVREKRRPHWKKE